MNIVHLVGYAAHNPDIRYFNNNKTLCKLSILVESIGPNDEVLTESIDLEMWNKTAQIVAKYVPKGRLFGVTGSLKISKWIDRSIGKLRVQPVVYVSWIYLIGHKAVNKPVSILDESDAEDHDDYDYDYDYDYGYEEYFDQEPDLQHEESDTFVDYGYLADVNNPYDYFHSLGDF
ncbi:single-stranded DNA-binding protein [Prochlorothrix hollandica]|uniref:single-stranded DNA-binding protein n=1 Tax=Prochlorothrix hollandica TaxID=1223 RepID=UPI000371559B|nr:single-stranded DNA-binding protein [Prochlorothrix hollandica]